MGKQKQEFSGDNIIYISGFCTEEQLKIIRKRKKKWLFTKKFCNINVLDNEYVTKQQLWFDGLWGFKIDDLQNIHNSFDHIAYAGKYFGR